MKLCVYLSSSEAVPQKYRQLTHELGKAIGEHGHSLVYGGNMTGLMGVLAEAAHNAGAHITGVVPQKLYDRGFAFPKCDDLQVTQDLRDRKAAMDAQADAFIALPGGLGTLEEIIEVLNLKYLRYHQKPVVFINFEGFYASLFQVFEGFFAERFTKRAITQLYADLPDVPAVFRYLDSYVPVEVEEKWYDRSTDEI
jgi:uncharacterized protein (TIGR00730 family)